MKELILDSYECFTAIIPFVILFMIDRPIQKGSWMQQQLRVLAICILAVYIAAVFHFTGAGTVFDLLRFQFTIRSEQMNLLPFSQHIDVVGYLQNVLLFIPLGLLLPLIWPQFGQMKKTVLAGLFFSFCIEFSQLWNNRCTDIDDLILNTGGAILGYLIYRLLQRICSLKNGEIKENTFGPAIYIGMMFLGRFLLFHELGIARLLYGF